MSINQDVSFVESVLPNTYAITVELNGIRCVSPTGIPQNADAEEVWASTMQAFRQYFGKRLLEVFHHTCSAHKDFIIYLDPVQLESRQQSFQFLADQVQELNLGYE
jgi:hypothetical protein